MSWGGDGGASSPSRRRSACHRHVAAKESKGGCRHQGVLERERERDGEVERWKDKRIRERWRGHVPLSSVHVKNLVKG